MDRERSAETSRERHDRKFASELPGGVVPSEDGDEGPLSPSPAVSDVCRPAGVHRRHVIAHVFVPMRHKGHTLFCVEVVLQEVTPPDLSH